MVGLVGKIVGGSAVAPEGVLRHVHPLGDSPRRCLADGGACVPKVLPAAELEGILAGLIVAVPLEPAGGAAVSNDVEEPQELAVEPPAGGDDAGEEGVLALSRKCGYCSVYHHRARKAYRFCCHCRSSEIRTCQFLQAGGAEAARWLKASD